MATADKVEVRISPAAFPDRAIGPMTEAEFVAWCNEDVRAEWVDGEVVLMSPSSYRHVDLANWLTSVLRVFVSHRGLGRAIGPEFTARLPPDGRRRVPDVLFIAKDRLHLIRPNHLEGAPDLAIEVVSPESQSRDRRDKYLDYQAAGVREYWIIDPGNDDLEAHTLGDDGRYRPIALADGRMASLVLPGFFVRPEWLWTSPPIDEWTALRELGLMG